MEGPRSSSPVDTISSSRALTLAKRFPLPQAGQRIGRVVTTISTRVDRSPPGFGVHPGAESDLRPTRASPDTDAVISVSAAHVTRPHAARSVVHEYTDFRPARQNFQALARIALYEAVQAERTEHKGVHIDLFA